MSVLIKGMERPKSCFDCRLRYESMDSERNVYQECPMIRGEIVLDVVYRHPACPLIEIPPHGDLIDRDALPRNRVEWEDIVNAPTIIEADCPPSTPLEQVWTELFGEDGE